MAEARSAASSRASQHATQSVPTAGSTLTHGLAAFNNPVQTSDVPSMLMLHNVYQQLWDQRKRQEDFSKRVDVSEKERLELQVKLRADLDDLGRQLASLHSSLGKKIRQIESRLEQEAQALQQKIQTYLNNQAPKQMVQPDEIRSSKQSDSQPAIHSGQVPNFNIAEDQATGKRKREDDISTASEPDELEPPPRNPPKRRRAAKPIQPFSSARSKTTNTRTAEFKSLQRAAQKRYQQTNPKNFTTVRRVLYDFIESISDLDVSKNLQQALIKEMPNSLRETKPRGGLRCLMACSGFSWTDVMRIAASVEVAEDEED